MSSALVAFDICGERQILSIMVNNIQYLIYFSQFFNYYQNHSTNLILNFFIKLKILSMNAPRFNLRNASLFLNSLKNKYSKQTTEPENVQDNTFIDEQQQLTSSAQNRNQNQENTVQKKYRTNAEEQCSDMAVESQAQFLNCQLFPAFTQQNQISSYKNDQQINLNPKNHRRISSLRQNQNHNLNNKNNDLTQSIQIQQRIFNKPQRTTSEQQKIKTQFCDLIIIKYLEQTLAIYKSDLSILQHNRQNLQQQIYFIGKKIAKISQTNVQNTFLNTQIDQLNKQLESTIQNYHNSNKKLFQKKLQLNSLFKNYQAKISKVFMHQKQLPKIIKNDYFNYSQFTGPNKDIDYFKTDTKINSYTEHYNQFLQFKSMQIRQINRHIQNCQSNPQKNQQQRKKYVKNLFEGKDQIYLSPQKVQQQKKVKREVQKQEIKPINQPVKAKKVLLYDDHDSDQEKQKGKNQKNKQKGKTLSQSQKALLLGDLKNFSKSFKLPK